MNILNWFSSVYKTLRKAIDFLFKYLAPIYKDLAAIIKEVKETDLENEAARKAVFQKITDFIQKQGLQKYPDSVLNACIEVVYIIIRWRIG